AAALADLEALRASGPVPERHIAMAATGGSLLLRVRRLLGAPSSHSGRGPAWLAATAAISLIGCVAYSAGNPRPVRDRRLAHTVEVNRRELRDLGTKLRADLQSDLRLAQRMTRLAATTLRQTARAVAGPRAAARRAPVVAEAVPVIDAPAEPIMGAGAPGTPVAVSAPGAEAPQSSPSSSTSVSERNGDSNGNWIWSNNGDRLEVTY